MSNNFMASRAHKIRTFLIIAACVVLAICTAVFVFNRHGDKFSLSPSPDDAGVIVESNASEIQSAISQKQSFIVFVSQEGCNAANELERSLLAVLDKHPTRVLEISFSELKESSIAPEVKFYPSVIIYHNGNVVDFLDAGSSDDTAAYTTTDGLDSWLSSYIKW